MQGMTNRASVVCHADAVTGTRPTLVVGAIIVDDLARPTRLLGARRTAPSALAGGWELPGGKVDPGEESLDALHREIREELGVAVEIGEPLPGPHRDGSWPLGEDYRMLVWWGRVTDGTPAALEDHDELRWFSVEDLYAVPWLPADLPIVRALASRLSA